MALGQRDASVLRRFEHFCALEGLRVDSALKDAHVVEAFLEIGCSVLCAHSLGTYRSVLRSLGAPSHVTRGFAPSRAPAPYNEHDVAVLWARAKGQSSPLRIANATVLLATMLGAGLRPRELAQLRGCDIVRSNAALSLAVTGRASRLVGLEGREASVLGELCEHRRGYLFRPGARARDSKNLVGEVARSLVGDPDEVALSSGRCRSTFLCRHLAKDTPLRELCAMAGIGDVESLLRYARHVPGAPQTKGQLLQRARR